MGRNLAFCAVVAVVAGCSAAPSGLMQSAVDQAEARSKPAFVPTPELAAGPMVDENGAQTRTDAAQDGGFWLVMAPPPAAEPKAISEGNAPATAPASQPGVAAIVNDEGMSYIPWRHRQGPAYPGNFWYTFGRWGKEMPDTLWDDTKATFTNPWTWAALGAAGAAGLALHGPADDHIADHYTRNGSQLNTFWDSVGDAGGNPGTHFAVAGAMYLTALARMDKPNYEKASTLINALAINGLVTVGLNLATNSHSPNGDEYDWPSGHTSSSFTFATVIWEQYGPWAGAPLMAFATFVGYERIDARNHDFSDVISGALIGMAIGHAVSQNHMPRIMGFDIIPYVSPSNGAFGVAATKRW